MVSEVVVLPDSPPLLFARRDIERRVPCGDFAPDLEAVALHGEGVEGAAGVGGLGIAKQGLSVGATRCG